MKDFTSVSSRWYKWQDRWRDFLHWAHSEESEDVYMLLILMIGIALLIFLPTPEGL